MSNVYMIKDENHSWGCVEYKRDIAPFIILAGVIGIDDSFDGPCSLIDYLGLAPTATKEEVLKHFERLAEPLQELILSQFGITIELVHVWSYQEYKHNKGEE